MKIELWPGLTPYEEGLRRMEAGVADVIAGGEERVFICQHEDVFTVGTSGDAAAEVLAAGSVPVVASGRGGKVTYHGPGQVVVYPIVDLSRRGKDLRAYVKALQEIVLEVLRRFGVEGHLTDDVGVWVTSPQGNPLSRTPSASLRGGTEEKIAAVGVRVRKWVAFHGLALNVDPDLAMFGRIVPCGIADKGVASLARVKNDNEINIKEVMRVMTEVCQERLGA